MTLPRPSRALRVAPLLLALMLGACASTTANTTTPPPPVWTGATTSSEPAPDADGDGVADAFDECPADAEDWKDDHDPDGCPKLATAVAVAPEPAAPEACVDGAVCKTLASEALAADRQEDAAALSRRACGLGSSDGCALLARLLHLGAGVPQNKEQGVELGRSACAGGSTLGCHNLAVWLSNGDGVARDVVEARRLFDVLCKSGHANACAVLAELSAPVAPDPAAVAQAAFEAKDFATATRLYQALCDQGHVNACASLGSSLWGHGKHKPAIAAWDRACTGGSAPACSWLAANYWDGDHVRIDKARGFKLATRGCDLGDPEGCQLAGGWSSVVYDDAVTWFAKGCALGHVASCASAASSCRFDNQAELAAQYERAACDLGEWDECFHLGDDYLEGNGVAQDDAAGCRYYRLACDHEHETACIYFENECDP